MTRVSAAAADSVTPWFAALPDLDAAAGYSAALRERANQVILHASGRPWLIGVWPPWKMRLVAAGDVRVALLGSCLAGSQRLPQSVDQAISHKDFDRLTKLPGSFHLAVSAPGFVRLYGDATGFRRVYFAAGVGTTVAGDRADVLASLVDAPLDERWLALRLTYPGVPHPLTGSSPWAEIHAVPPGHHVTVDAGGRSWVTTYWQIPSFERPLSEGAEGLRDALTWAVEGRLNTVRRASCDLSGGKDSAALFFLAARVASSADVSLLALTLPCIVPENDDAAWAALATLQQPDVQHSLVDAADCPLPFADLDAVPLTDEPSAIAVHTARYRRLAELSREHGSKVHLSGHGGDEVLHSPLAYVHDMLRQRPRHGLSHVRGYRSLFRLPFRACVRPLLDSRPFGVWLSHVADGLGAPEDEGSLPGGWSFTPKLPPWVTADAAQTVRDAFRRAATEGRPLAPTRGQHATLDRIHGIARTARLYAQGMAEQGLRVEFPYLDTAIMEACLAVRMHERTTPWRFKPLLDEAMRGVVPQALLNRRTKGHYTTDFYLGLRRHRDRLTELLDDPILARLGLVDAARLRDASTGTHSEDVSPAALAETLACELWVRTQKPRMPRPTVTGGVQ